MDVSEVVEGDELVGTGREDDAEATRLYEREAMRERNIQFECLVLRMSLTVARLPSCS